MGNIGTPELFIVLIVALLVLGPNRLPQAARQFGKAMSEFRRVTSGLQAEMRDAVSTIENEIKSTMEEEPKVPPPAPYIFEPPVVGPNPHLPLGAPPTEAQVAEPAELAAEAPATPEANDDAQTEA